jgi:ATP-dependent helicase/DNAse subunit B
MVEVIVDKNLCAATEKTLKAVSIWGSKGGTPFKGAGSPCPIFIIVPDRFSLQAEKILVNHAKCLVGVRVVTFSMLYSVLNPVGGETVGKSAAVLHMWCAVKAVKTELVYFANSAEQYAFAEKMFDTINQLSSSNADFSTLEQNAVGEITKRKMHDISLIYKKYKELLGNRLDGSRILDWLINNVGKSEAIKNACVYVVGFEYLSIQREEVLKQIMKSARLFICGVREGSELQRRINEIRFAM